MWGKPSVASVVSCSRNTEGKAGAAGDEARSGNLAVGRRWGLLLRTVERAPERE